MNDRKTCLAVLALAGLCWATAMLNAAKSSPGGGAVWSELVINPGRQCYDTTPAMTMLPDGTGWAVWKAYLRGKERVVARRIGPGERPVLGPAIELDDRPGVADRPQVVAGDFGLWFFWAARRHGRWAITARQRTSDRRWLPVQVISDARTDSIRPSALAAPGGRVVVSWSGYEGSTSRIWWRVWQHGRWGPIRAASDSSRSAFRPALVGHAGQVWLFWDEYVGTESVIKARQVLPEAGPVERVSPAEELPRRCLMPAAASAPALGLCVAWLKLTDVIGGEGAVDQLHTLQLAVRRDGRWELARQQQGGAEAAYLIRGVLPDLRSRKGYPSGYLGRRRHPQLVAARDGVWLVWEEKAEHMGRATETTGRLLGRFYGGRWGRIVRLHEGLLDYRVVRPAVVRDGRFFVLGSDLPDRWTRPYHRVAIEPAAARPAPVARWDDQYRPVRLPLGHDPPRHTIQAGGRTYRLYWADMHCHCGFTPDAEGEPDEVLHYGRDRARLDMMVLQDNDDIYHCFLTESQYWLAVLHSQRITQPGRFLALPGYEWTQRVAEPGARFNPLLPAYGENGRDTFPNHRTVIYPMKAGPIVRHPEVAGRFDLLCDAVERAGGILIAQHHIFVPSRRRCETNMEVVTGWGIYIHRRPEFFHRLLNEGYRLGFVGCGDSHRRNPGLCGGLTGIYAESLTPDAVIDALRRRRCFATSGSKIAVDARANGQLMGGEVRAADGRVVLELTAVGTRPVVSARLIEDGKEVKTFSGDGSKTLRVRYQRIGLGPGRHWYYWEVAQQGTSRHYSGNTCVAQGHLAWSSPLWVLVP